MRGNHILFKSTAKLLIVAGAMCVLFGNGLHFHFVLTHLFDHEDIHANVHVHASESNHHVQDPEFEDEDAHQHPAATVDLTATLTQKTISKASTATDIFSSSAILSDREISKNLIPLYLDLPPPDLLDHFYYFSSHTTRGPPVE